MQEISTFINFSGGVDSTYILWRWLLEHPKEIVVVHHCLYFKRRLEEEKKACHAILDFFNRQGLTNYLYVETGMQKGTMEGRVMDIEVLCGLSAIVAKLHPTIKNVLLTYCKEETSKLNNHILGGGTIYNFDSSHRYFKVNQVFDILGGKKYKYILPMEEGGLLSKRYMIRNMPKELFDLTWFCRNPIEGVRCHTCHTCKKVNRILQEGS